MNASIKYCFVRFSAVLLVLALFSPQLFAQNYRGNRQSRPSGQNYTQGNYARSSVHWSQQFKPPVRERDFGAVPRASKQEVVFEFVNTLDQPLYLTGVRVSCGCTIPKILTSKVAPGETAKIHAKFDTLKFKGKKQATVSVSLRRDKPYSEYAEIQFMVKGKIRQDVVFNPGEIAFKNVNPGEGAVRTATIKYAGSPNWQIVDIKSTNGNIEVSKKELRRDLNTRRIDYELTLRLSEDQPMGAFNDQLTIITNDRSQRQISVNVIGNIQAILKASPVQLGAVRKDQKIEKKLILKGSRPFSVRSISTGDSRIKFSSVEGKKTLHILTYQLDTSVAGKIHSQIKIETDDPGQPTALVPFDARILKESETFTVNN